MIFQPSKAFIVNAPLGRSSSIIGYQAPGDRTTRDRDASYAFQQAVRGVRSAGVARYLAPPIDREIEPPILSAYLVVAPLSGIDSSGGAGGPFDVDSVIYTLKNSGGAPLTWSAASAEAWLSVIPATGSLDPGESINVTIEIVDSQTGDLPFGLNEGSVTFTNLTNGAGGATIDVDLTIDVDPTITSAVTFDQYDGPIQYPAFAFERNGRFFYGQSVSGVNTFKTAPIGVNPTSKDCSFGGMNPPSGLITTTYSGSVSYSTGGVPTGSLDALVERQGAIGAYDFPGTPGTSETVTAPEFEALLTEVSLARGYIGWGVESSVELPDSSARTLRTTNTGTGFFAGSFGGPYNNIWCAGQSIAVTYFDMVTPETMGEPVARTGTPARTQTISSYDSGTRTFSGNLSRANIIQEVDESRDTATITYSFLVTPTVGDPYTITVVREYVISGPSVSDSIMFPQIVDAEVYFSGMVLNYLVSAYDDFESYSDGWYESLDPIGTWNAEASFGAPSPNTMVYDDFESYDVGQASGLLLGWGWAGQGSNGTTDQSRVYDDFEGYSAGTISIYYNGVGWAGNGASHVVFYTRAYDDFESYPVGAISVLDYTSIDNAWAGDGTIG